MLYETLQSGTGRRITYQKANAFDHAVNTCAILGTDFVKMFIASSVASEWKMVNLLILQVKAALKSFGRLLQKPKGKSFK